MNRGEEEGETETETKSPWQTEDSHCNDICGGGE